MKQTLKNLIVPALTAIALTVIVALPAWAYFTASDYASGWIEIKTPNTGITEKYGEGKKVVTIHNEEDSVPVWVRARAFSASELDVDISGEGWTGPVNDWYEYDDILFPGDDTKPLIAKIEWPFKPEDVGEDGTYVISSTGSDEGGEDGGTSEITVGIASGTNYNVVVVYEAQPVKYDADNNPIPPVWPYKGGE